MSRDPKITHKIMSAVKSKGTRPELALCKELWHRKLRYRRNDKRLPGKPDIVFTRAKLVVFCDGDFWHGHNWAIRGYGSLERELQRYSSDWGAKILRNMERDEQIAKRLTELGWQVLRIWESEIKADVKRCGDRVEFAYWNSIRNRRKDWEGPADYEE